MDWMELLKVGIPTVGAIVVFMTWRGGKLIDLSGKFFELHGEVSYKVQSASIKLSLLRLDLKRAGEKYEKALYASEPQIEQPTKNLLDRWDKVFVKHKEFFNDMDSALYKAYLKVQKKKFLTVRFLGNSIGNLLSMSTRIKLLLDEIEDYPDVVKGLVELPVDAKQDELDSIS